MNINSYLIFLLKDFFKHERLILFCINNFLSYHLTKFFFLVEDDPNVTTIFRKLFLKSQCTF